MLHDEVERFRRRADALVAEIAVRADDIEKFQLDRACRIDVMVLVPPPRDAVGDDVADVAPDETTANRAGR